MTPPLGANPRHIVVLCPTWVGDTIMATCVFRALRTERPSARITAAVRPALAPLLAGLATVDDVLSCVMSGLGGPFRTARQLRATDASALLLLPNSFRSGLTAWRSRVPIRIGWRRDGRSALLTHALAPPAAGAAGAAPVPTVDTYADLVARALGVASVPAQLELATTAEEDTAAARLVDPTQPYVVLNPGANRRDKRWPAERFAAVGNAFHGDGLAVAVTGGPEERELVASVVAAMKTPAIDLVEAGVDLASLKSVIKRATLLVSNDTGPRHIALAFGTPLISLFGPTDHRWTHLSAPCERILVAEPFLPDTLIADRHPRQCRIERITTGDVLAAARALLDARPPAGS